MIDRVCMRVCVRDEHVRRGGTTARDGLDKSRPHS